MPMSVLCNVYKLVKISDVILMKAVSGFDFLNLENVLL